MFFVASYCITLVSLISMPIAVSLTIVSAAACGKSAAAFPICQRLFLSIGSPSSIILFTIARFSAVSGMPAAFSAPIAALFPAERFVYKGLSISLSSELPFTSNSICWPMEALISPSSLALISTPLPMSSRIWLPSMERICPPMVCPVTREFRTALV